MGLFSSIAGAGLSLLGNKLAGKQERRGAAAQMEAVDPLDIRGPLGRAEFSGGDLTLSLPGPLNQAFNQANRLGSGLLSDLGRMDFQGREAAELERLQTLRQPSIDIARERLMSNLLNRGRLGAAEHRGVSGLAYQPEIAAQEEAIARMQLGDIAAARDFSQQEQGFLLNQATGLFGLGQGIGSGATEAGRLSLGGRAPVGAALAQGLPAYNAAAGTRGFFGGLADYFGSNPDIFGGARSPGPVYPPGSRPNGLGGLFL